MIQTSPATYTVADGELVTVTIATEDIFRPHSTGSYDDKICELSSKRPDVYKFVVHGNSGERHRFVYQCFFANGDPQGAQYKVTTQGDGGGGEFFVNLVSRPEDGSPAISDITYTIA